MEQLLGNNESFNQDLYNYLGQFMIPYFVYYPHNFMLGHLHGAINSFVSFQGGNQYFYNSGIRGNQGSIDQKLKQDREQRVSGDSQKHQVLTFPNHHKNRTIIQRQQLKTRKIRPIKKNRSKSHSHQNEIRNIFSNIARLIINFVALEIKSKPYLIKAIKYQNLQNEADIISEFYREALNSKKKIRTVYLSKSTFFEFLGLQVDSRNQQISPQPESPEHPQKFKRLIRRLAYFYCHSILIKQVIHSKKINPHLRENHLKIANSLLRTLKSLQTH